MGWASLANVNWGDERVRRFAYGRSRVLAVEGVQRSVSNGAGMSPSWTHVAPIRHTELLARLGLLDDMARAQGNRAVVCVQSGDAAEFEKRTKLVTVTRRACLAAPGTLAAEVSPQR